MTSKIRTCTKPFVKLCDGAGNETCKTVLETSCSTKYTQNDGIITKSDSKYDEEKDAPTEVNEKLYDNQNKSDTSYENIKQMTAETRCKFCTARDK